MAIKLAILSTIEQGAWPLGCQIPTEEQLQIQFGASRGTIRRAIHELEVEGYLRRYPAKGTFVIQVKPRLEKRQREVLSFSQQMMQAGVNVSTDILFKGIIQAKDAIGRVLSAFSIAPDEKVIHIMRLRRGDGMPFSLQSVYLMREDCPDILECDLTSLFSLYRNHFQREIVAADEILQVSHPSPEESSYLGVASDAPIVIRDRISFDQAGRAFEVLHSVDRSDCYHYRYSIVSDRTDISLLDRHKEPLCSNSLA